VAGARQRCEAIVGGIARLDRRLESRLCLGQGAHLVFVEVVGAAPAP
jgi:hypothetical protein